MSTEQAPQIPEVDAPRGGIAQRLAKYAFRTALAGVVVWAGTNLDVMSERTVWSLAKGAVAPEEFIKFQKDTPDQRALALDLASTMVVVTTSDVDGLHRCTGTIVENPEAPEETDVLTAKHCMTGDNGETLPTEIRDWRNDEVVGTVTNWAVGTRQDIALGRVATEIDLPGVDLSKLSSDVPHRGARFAVSSTAQAYEAAPATLTYIGQDMSFDDPLKYAFAIDPQNAAEIAEQTGIRGTSGSLVMDGPRHAAVLESVSIVQSSNRPNLERTYGVQLDVTPRVIQMEPLTPEVLDDLRGVLAFG